MIAIVAVNRPGSRPVRRSAFSRGWRYGVRAGAATGGPAVASRRAAPSGARLHRGLGARDVGRRVWPRLAPLRHEQDRRPAVQLPGAELERLAFVQREDPRAGRILGAGREGPAVEPLGADRDREGPRGERSRDEPVELGPAERQPVERFRRLELPDRQRAPPRRVGVRLEQRDRRAHRHLAVVVAGQPQLDRGRRPDADRQRDLPGLRARRPRSRARARSPRRGSTPTSGPRRARDGGPHPPAPRAQPLQRGAAGGVGHGAAVRLGLAPRGSRRPRSSAAARRSPRRA